MTDVDDTNRMLDEAFGGEDGVSPIRFGAPADEPTRTARTKRHPSEITILRRDGRYVRRLLRQAEPPESTMTAGRFALLLLAGGLIWVGFFAFLIMALS